MDLGRDGTAECNECFPLLLVAWTPDPTHAQLIEGVRSLLSVPALMVAMALARPREQHQRLPELMLTYGTGTLMVTLCTGHHARALSERNNDHSSA